MANTMSKYGSNTNRPLSEIVGLSTDAKPTDSIEGVQIQNGSSFRELDTGKKFLFDAENTTWNEVSSGGGGGGSTLIEKSISDNGVYNASDDSADGYSKVTVDVPSGGGGSATRKDVNFYDYDGTIVNSYTAVEFANLSAMPSNPTHEGLTAQGWNWSLANAKSYVADYGKLNIGQMYITFDGKTRLYISLPEGRTSPILQLYLNANSELDIDWGDGSTHSTFTSTSADYKSERHEYSASGDYVIAITAVSGGFALQSSSTNPSSILWNGNNSTSSPDKAYNNAIKKIEIGDTVTGISRSAFIGCYSLSTITIPDGVTSIGQYAFSSCSSLSSVTIPDRVTGIDSYAFQNCNSLSSVTIPDGVTSIGNYAFDSCSSLVSVTIPDSVASISDYFFSHCHSLSSVTIPDGVTSIGNYAFDSCFSLSTITIPDTVTSIGTYAFQKCSSLVSVTINKFENGVYGYPWGATIGSPTYTDIIWTKSARFKYNCKEIASGTTLTGAVDATVGDLVVATFVIRGNTYTIDSGWTLLGIGDNGALNQRTAMAYKIATSSSESLTVTQDTSGRIYINLVSITGASVGTFSGFTTQATGSSITLPKPQGLVVWGVSASYWGTSSPYELWGLTDYKNVFGVQLPDTTQPRCLTALDQSNNATETFRYSPDMSGDAAIAAASLTITGIDNFWY